MATPTKRARTMAAKQVLLDTLINTLGMLDAAEEADTSPDPRLTKEDYRSAINELSDQMNRWADRIAPLDEAS